METKTIRRYRIRTRHFLCISPEEAAGTGITVAEETIEELTLIPNPGLGIFLMFAAIIDKPNDEIEKIPIMKRGELVFERKNEAVHYIKEKGEGTFILCGVKSTRVVSKDEINESLANAESSKSIDTQLKYYLKSFDKRSKP